MRNKNYKFETLMIHGHDFKDQHGSVSLPIHQTSTFQFESTEHGGKCFLGEADGYIYTRVTNPTHRALEQVIASMEGADDCVAFGSGMAAISHLVLHFCGAGDNYICGSTVYGGTMGLATHVLPKHKIEARFISGDCADELESKIDANTKLVFLETPANPTLRLIDIEMIANVCKKHNIPFCVDNTFCSPYLQKPLQHGATMVMHSGTKYLNGHGDVISGFIVGEQQFINSLRLDTQLDLGGIISPFNAWLILRGIKTLAVRMEKHSDNAEIVAKWLLKQEKISNVAYPGLEETNPKFDLFKKQMKRGSGLVSFEVGSTKAEAARFCDNLKLCTLAVSLGDCDTLIQHPASMTHSPYSVEELEVAGIKPNTVRISVGLENVDDIIADLELGLSKV
ncbi:MAG: aminotransferase class I/II-fold pyridoxal phosphate-dependent enzyme [Candidatus Delongbacteria bacterium]|nr:aminotransferase class I/II-fold pyridoxal phosphate-dependent enzyme [Candidatus Delongbacteria bacterium]MBN2833829.1 aminotransferase class I/II-fold pyridoxal phosphate-dependent enzyme [Candidatus Delongbacteria bacterium]